MMIFSKDTDVARSIPTSIASYSVLILDVGKSSRMACSILSPICALGCKPTPAPVCRKVSSTLRIHQPVLPGSTSYWGISSKKSTNFSHLMQSKVYIEY